MQLPADSSASADDADDCRCSCQQMQLPTDPSADNDPNAGSKMMPLPMQVMPLNMPLLMKNMPVPMHKMPMSANAEDADVCRCTRCQCLPLKKMPMFADAKDADVCRKNADVCLYQPMLMLKAFPMQTVTMSADAVAHRSLCLC